MIITLFADIDLYIILQFESLLSCVRKIVRNILFIDCLKHKTNFSIFIFFYEFSNFQYLLPKREKVSVLEK